jgi:hypothetical protein
MDEGIIALAVMLGSALLLIRLLLRSENADRVGQPSVESAADPASPGRAKPDAIAKIAPALAAVGTRSGTAATKSAL